MVRLVTNHLPGHQISDTVVLTGRSSLAPDGAGAHVKTWGLAIIGLASAGASGAQTVSMAGPSPEPPGIAATLPVTTKATLLAGTPVTVMTNDEISTTSCKVGERFGVTVVHDVTSLGVVVIPAGASGGGEVTFCTNKGGFGKPGIIGIALRELDLNGKKTALDGRYREEGRNNNGAAAATMFAVGIFAMAVTGKVGVIPKGRELRARTGEDIFFDPHASPPASPPIAPAQPVDAANNDSPPGDGQLTSQSTSK